MERNERAQLIAIVSTGVLIILFIIAYRFFNPSPIEIYNVTANTTVTGGDYVAESDKININTADAAELKELKGIGDKLSANIISFREENGLFTSIYDLMDVDGISENLFLKIEPYITV